MNELYNFLFSWQLFPEMGTYHTAERPKSGTYKINYLSAASLLQIDLNWVGMGECTEEEVKQAYDKALKSLDEAEFKSTLNQMALKQ